jgi:hypothetical protein
MFTSRTRVVLFFHRVSEYNVPNRSAVVLVIVDALIENVLQ